MLLSYPYYLAVEDLTRSGIINGAPGGLFLPGDPVTRQQFSKMIVLGGEYEVSEDDVCPFIDVDQGRRRDALSRQLRGGVRGPRHHPGQDADSRSPPIRASRERR